MTNRHHPRDETALPSLRAALEKESSDGLALLRDLADNPICTVRIDETVPCLAVVWKQYATSKQLRFIHESMLDLLQKHGLCKVVGDDTGLTVIHAEDQRWIIEKWMPRAVAAGLRFAASKKPAAYFGKASVENVKAGAPAALVIRTFDDIDAARHWIASADSR